MGLAVSVGYLADLLVHDAEGAEWARKDLQRLEDFLEEEGVSGFEEPEELDRSLIRPHCASFPYSFLHYLRRVYALSKRSPDVSIDPVGDEGIDAYDTVVEDESMMMDSHLLCHADHAGFYVPVEFSEPLFDVNDRGIAGGGMVGSSYGLRDELVEIAPHLDIELGEGGVLDDAEFDRVSERTDPAQSDPFERELIVWLALFENARASIELGSAIWFH